MEYDVTIGIPLYKSVEFIRKTMDSALVQSYPNIEFLIVDDAGNDGSLSIVRELQSTHPRGKDIHILINQKNLGVSASRNRIIDEAKGNYLFFLDSDDVISPNAIELLMQNIRQYDAEIVFGSYEKIEISGQRNVYQYPSLQLLGEDQLAVFAYRKYAGIQATACNILIKRSLLTDNHIYFIDSAYWEDFAFTFDLVTYISRAVLIPDITYTYKCREGSLSHYQNRETISKKEIMMNASVVDHLKQTSSLVNNKVYYPQRCFNLVMTDFYIACNILKRRNDIVPPISDLEIKALMSHPATFRQIISFQQFCLKNLAIFILGKLPVPLCVNTIRCVGRLKKLI